jgi:hypothetical protein
VSLTVSAIPMADLASAMAMLSDMVAQEKARVWFRDEEWRMKILNNAARRTSEVVVGEGGEGMWRKNGGSGAVEGIYTVRTSLKQ